MRTSSSRRDFLKAAGLSAAAGLTASCTLPGHADRPPNIVVIFLDDSGFADFRPFGAPAYDTPNVRQLAAGGCRFSNFHVPQAICSASRGALLTGCYPERTGLVGAHGPRARGMDPKWPTIAQVLKPQGYATAVFGKWHIGDQPDTRPPARGFDESCGLMVSNDMWRHHPESRHFDAFPLQFWENGKVVIDDVTPEDQTRLTQWYTEHAVDFIRRKKDQPFFLYVPHSMPHVPLAVGERFKGKSGAGLYGDVMLEIDWSVGEIMRALRETGVEDNTLVVFTSDNGPWSSYGNHAGATPYRDAKGTGFDGGTRSACVMKLPGRIRPGIVSDAMLCTIDLLPTFARLAGAPLPQTPVDGLDVWDLIAGRPGAANPHDYYAFTTGKTFEGLFSGDGRWKLHLPHAYRSLVKAGHDGRPGTYEKKEIGLSLFDMAADPRETASVLDRHPDVAARLQALAAQHRREFFGEPPSGEAGRPGRPARGRAQ
ncbi:MAG TPA: sulfatase [Kiritimatiellia bacterium]|nr:sulfatase [Kiritimatiellia bacterium]HPS09340.1 sulfatase [Kiritimatiellia bacterium]